MNVSHEKFKVVGVEFTGTKVYILGKRCFGVDRYDDGLSHEVTAKVAELVPQFRLSCMDVSQVAVGQIVLAHVKFKDNANPGLFRFRITGILAEEETVKGVFIDRCQWHFNIKMMSLLTCPPIVQAIEPVCEVLYLADVSPPSIPSAGMGAIPGVRYPNSPDNPSPLVHPSYVCDNNALFLTQFVSEISAPPDSSTWQISNSRVVVKFNPAGAWPEASVLAINEMLLGTDVCGRVFRELGKQALFYPLDPAGSGMLLTDVLAKQGYAIRESVWRDTYGKSDSRVQRAHQLQPPVNSMSNFLFRDPKVTNSDFGHTNAFPYAPKPKPLTFMNVIYPPGTYDSCRVLGIERGPWKFTIQLQSQRKDLKLLRMFLNRCEQGAPCPISEITVGACVVARRSSDRLLHRAMVSLPPASGKVTVFFIDLGENDQVPCDSVFSGTPDVVAVPQLSILCRLEGLPDHPDAKICKEFHKTLASEGFSLVATITRSVEKNRLTHVHLQVAFKTSTHPLIDLILQPAFEEIRLGDGDKVLVAYHDGVSCFVIFHLHKNLNLVDSIQESVCQSSCAPLACPPCPGMPCLAPHEGEYYRARVVSCDARAETVEVYFVDYGNIGTHPVGSLLALPASLLSPAAQACVAAVAPSSSPSFAAASDPTSVEAILQLLAEIGEDVVEIRTTGGHRSFMGKSVPVVQLVKSAEMEKRPAPKDPFPITSSPGSEPSPVSAVAAQLHSDVDEKITPGSLMLCRVIHVQKDRCCIVLKRDDHLVEVLTNGVEHVVSTSDGSVGGDENVACGDTVGLQLSTNTVADTGNPLPKWLRGKVSSINKDACCVTLIDVGPCVTVSLQAVKRLPPDLVSIPSLGIWCQLDTSASSPTAVQSLVPLMGMDCVVVHFLHLDPDSGVWNVKFFEEYQSPVEPRSVEGVFRYESFSCSPGRNGSMRPCDIDLNWRVKSAATDEPSAAIKAAHVSSAKLTSAVDQKIRSGSSYSKLLDKSPTPLKQTGSDAANLVKAKSPCKINSHSLLKIEKYLTKSKSSSKALGSNRSASVRENNEKSVSFSHPIQEAVIYLSEDAEIERESPTLTAGLTVTSNLGLLRGPSVSLEQQIHVQVTWVVSPVEFWCHVLGPENDLFYVVHEKFTSSPRSQMQPVSSVSPGDLVAAPYATDQCWYRALVLSSSGDEHRVFFLDFGNEENVASSDLMVLPEYYVALPLQAVPCRLSRLSPTGGTWSAEALSSSEDILYQNSISLYVSSLPRDELQVSHDSRTQFPTPYNDTCCVHSVRADARLDLAQHLVQSGYAQTIDENEEIVESLYTDPNTSRDCARSDSIQSALSTSKDLSLSSETAELSQELNPTESVARIDELSVRATYAEEAAYVDSGAASVAYAEEGAATAAHVEEGAAIAAHVEEGAAIAAHVEEGAAIAAHVEEGAATAAHVEEGATIAAHVEEGAAIAAHVEEGAAIAAHVEEGAAIAAHVEEGAAIAAHVEEGAAIAAHVEEGAAIAAYVEEGAAIAAYVEEGAAIAAHVEEGAAAIAAHVEEGAAAIAAHVEENRGGDIDMNEDIVRTPECEGATALTEVNVRGVPASSESSFCFADKDDAEYVSSFQSVNDEASYIQPPLVSGDVVYLVHCEPLLPNSTNDSNNNMFHCEDSHKFGNGSAEVSDVIDGEAMAVTYLQRHIDTVVLEQMVTDIEVAVHHGQREIRGDAMTPWMYCLAKSPSEGVSYRAVLEDCTRPDAGVVVRYLDYGNTELITDIPASILECPENLLARPPLAYRCLLAHSGATSPAALLSRWQDEALTSTVTVEADRGSGTDPIVELYHAGVDICRGFDSPTSASAANEIGLVDSAESASPSQIVYLSSYNSSVYESPSPIVGPKNISSDVSIHDGATETCSENITVATAILERNSASVRKKQVNTDTSAELSNNSSLMMTGDDGCKTSNQTSILCRTPATTSPMARSAIFQDTTLAEVRENTDGESLSDVKNVEFPSKKTADLFSFKEEICPDARLDSIAKLVEKTGKIVDLDVNEEAVSSRPFIQFWEAPDPFFQLDAVFDPFLQMDATSDPSCAQLGGTSDPPCAQLDKTFDPPCAQLCQLDEPFDPPCAQLCQVDETFDPPCAQLDETFDPPCAQLYQLDETFDPPGAQLCQLDEAFDPPCAQLCQLDETFDPLGAQLCQLDETFDPPGAQLCQLDETFDPPGAQLCQLDETSDPPCAQLDETLDPLCAQLGETLNPLCAQLDETLDPLCAQLDETLDPLCAQLDETLDPLCAQLDETLDPLCAQLDETLDPLCAQLDETLDPLCAQLDETLDPLCAQLDEASDLPCAQLDEASDLPCAQLDEASDLPCAQLDEASDLPCAQLDEASDLPCSQLDEASDLPCSQLDEASDLPRVQLDEVSDLPRAQLDEASDLPCAQLDEASDLQCAQLDEASDLPCAQLDEASDLPCAQLDEASDLPCAQLDEASDLQCAQLDDKFESLDLSGSDHDVFYCNSFQHEEALRVFHGRGGVSFGVPKCDITDLNTHVKNAVECAACTKEPVTPCEVIEYSTPDDVSVVGFKASDPTSRSSVLKSKSRCEKKMNLPTECYSNFLKVCDIPLQVSEDFGESSLLPRAVNLEEIVTLIDEEENQIAIHDSESLVQVVGSENNNTDYQPAALSETVSCENLNVIAGAEVENGSAVDGENVLEMIGGIEDPHVTQVCLDVQGSDESKNREASENLVAQKSVDTERSVDSLSESSLTSPWEDISSCDGTSRRLRRTFDTDFSPPSPSVSPIYYSESVSGESVASLCDIIEYEEIKKTDNNRRVESSSKIDSVESCCKTWSLDHPLKSQRESRAYMPKIPKMGEIYSIKIAQMNSDLSMDIQFRDDVSQWIEMSEQLESFARSGKMVRLKHFALNSFCITLYKVDYGWYRAKLLARLAENESLVLFFDYGNYEVVSNDDIFEMPEQFWDVPAQAVKVEFDVAESCKDHDKISVVQAITNMSPSANVSVILKQGPEKQLMISDLFVEGQSLIPSLVCYECGNNVIVDGYSVDKEKELTRIRGYSTTFPPLGVPFEVLLSVSVTVIRNDQFCVTLDENACDAARFRDQLNSFMIKSQPECFKVRPTVGSACAVYNLNDFAWRRARVLEWNESGSAVVLFVDYGSYVTVSQAEMFPFPEKFTRLAAQAIFCGFDDGAMLNHKMNVLRSCDIGDLKLEFKQQNDDGVFLVSKALVRGSPIIDSAIELSSSGAYEKMSKILTPHPLSSSEVPRFAFKSPVISSPCQEESVVSIEELVMLNNVASVRVLKIADDCSIVVRLLKNENAWRKLLTDLQTSMNSSCGLPFVSCPPSGSFCAARGGEDHWFRGVVVSPDDTSSKHVIVRDVDVCTIVSVPVFDIFPLPQKFFLVPSHCIRLVIKDLEVCPNHDYCTALDFLAQLENTNLDIEVVRDAGTLSVVKFVLEGRSIFPSSLCAGSCDRRAKTFKAASLVTRVGLKSRPLRSLTSLLPISEEDELSDSKFATCSSSLENLDDSMFTGTSDEFLDKLKSFAAGNTQTRCSQRCIRAFEESTICSSSIEDRVTIGRITHVDDSLSFSLWVIPNQDIDVLSFINSSLEETWPDLQIPEHIAFRDVYGASLPTDQVDSVTSNSFYRVVVLDAVGSNLLNVLFIDVGKRTIVPRDSLKVLPAYISDVHPLAVQIFMPVKVKQDSSQVRERLSAKALGEVCAYGYTGEPGNKPSHNPSVVVTSHLGNVAKYLVREGLAEFRDASYVSLSEELEQVLSRAVNDQLTENTDAGLIFTTDDLETRLNVLKQKL